MTFRTSLIKLSERFADTSAYRMKAIRLQMKCLKMAPTQMCHVPCFHIQYLHYYFSGRRPQFYSIRLDQFDSVKPVIVSTTPACLVASALVGKSSASTGCRRVEERREGYDTSNIPINKGSLCSYLVL